MNQPKIKLIAMLIVLLGVLGVSAWLTASIQTANTANDEASQVENQTAETAEAGRTEITYAAKPGITSLEQLQEEAKNVVVEESGYGKIVTSIEGHDSGTDGNYWSFYVNGEMAQVGADAYVQQEGDVILWKFQKL